MEQHLLIPEWAGKSREKQNHLKCSERAVRAEAAAFGWENTKFSFSKGTPRESGSGFIKPRDPADLS